MDDLYEALRQFDALRTADAGGDIVQPAEVDSVEPSLADPSVLSDLSPVLQRAVAELGITSLYQHQADAIRLAMDGESNVVLQAPTASGKSLAFQIPMLDSLARDHRAHALMIYPTKALAVDQRVQLQDLAERIQGRKIESWFYDGDVDAETRAIIRKKPPAVLFTNPDMLHKTFLGNADLWDDVLRHLRWVIVDEMHEYRGYFGSNVSMILRRFSHHLAQLGATPQFFLSSATSANAREHAEQLTGLPFKEIGTGASMRPRRTFWFVQPDIPQHQYWQILQLRTVNAGLACLSTGRSVLAFCPSREFAEKAHRLAMRRADELIAQGETGIDKNMIKVFRAGLDVKDRHEIQRGLKDGSIRLAFTTNALELGIDIGGLDGVILAGFPDNVMSAWQRIGRAGRRWDSHAFVLYFARNNALDVFYAANLRSFLEKPLDDLVINPGNEELIERHVPCLLFETSSIDGGRQILGDDLYEAAKKALDNGELPPRVGRYRPHNALDIRGAGGGMFELKRGNKVIGTMSGHQKFREAFPGAIYMHGGATYRVESVKDTGTGGEINLESAESHLSTNIHLRTTLSVQNIFAGHQWTHSGTAIDVYYGDVTVTEFITSVTEVNDLTGTETKLPPPNDSAQFSKAHSCWIQIESGADDVGDGIPALQHLLRIGAQHTVPVDAHDVFPHAETGDQTVYLVEAYPGGIGVARKAFDRWRAMIEFGIGVASDCGCTVGCPKCIVPPRARGDLDKRAGITVAQMLLQQSTGLPTRKLSGGRWQANT